jgi:4'-phosphopantetheinyl transferase
VIGVVRPVEPGVPLAPPPLGPGTVQLWQADLDDPRWRLDDLDALLSEDERARRARLRFDHLRRRFAVRRAVLRLLLGAYLSAPPAGLRFGAGGRGKPELIADDGAGRLHFNLSDSDSRALYVVTRLGPVGVDVEALAPIADMGQVARHWFSAREQAELAGLPEEQRTLGFYLAWTRKEALVKAEGGGLGLPLDRFSVSLTPGEPARLLASDLPLLREFVLFDVPVAGPFVAAYAVWRT